MAWPPSSVCRRVALVIFGASLLLYLTVSAMLFGLGLGARAVVVVAQLVALLGLSLWMARLLRIPLREAFALRPPAAAHWLMVLATAVPLQALGGGIQHSVLRTLPPDSPIRTMMERSLGDFVAVDGAGDLLMLFLAAVIVAAVCEELLFRGLLLQLLRRRSGWPSAIVWSAVLFALYHLNPVVLLPVGLVGIYLAVLVWRSGSLYPAIVAHALNNGLALFGSPLVIDEAVYDRYLGITVAVSAALLTLLVWQYFRYTPAPPPSGTASRESDATVSEAEAPPGPDVASPASSADDPGPTPTAPRRPGRLEDGGVDGGLGDGEQPEHSQ